MAALPLPALAKPRRFELVPPWRCLAGEWGKPRWEWRVQLGVFGADNAADRYIVRLAKAGIKSERYIAIWLMRDEDEPPVVVSETVLERFEAARRLAAQIRRRGFSAFPRHYIRYV